MAIEKMALVSIEGALRRVNRTLMKCCESECFHIIPYVRTNQSNYSSQTFKTLKDKNPYTALLKRGEKLAEGLGIETTVQDTEGVEYFGSLDYSDYLTDLEERFKHLSDERERVATAWEQHTNVLSQLEQLSGLSSNFQEIFALKYIKVRFGRLPFENYQKLKYYADRNFLFFPFETTRDYVWGVYFTPKGESVLVDDIFASLYFERIKIPSYVTGNAQTAQAQIVQLIEKERAALDVLESELGYFKQEVSEHFPKALWRLKALNESYELRADVAVINNQFFLSGYVPEQELDSFMEMINQIDGVDIQVLPPDSDPTVEPPVRLKNNWLFKPFEMFVKMYGLPTYNNIDPTPFVAITYILIYGIMFGDVGHGLLLILAGYAMAKWKNLKIGHVLERVGVSGMFFGVIYGSVFGNEEIIKPFYHHENVYRALGFSEMPHNIFQVSTVLIGASIGIGVIVILAVMILNVVTCLRNKDFQKGFLGSSGICGIVLYSSVVFGAVGQLLLGTKTFTPLYVGVLIILPIVLMLFKEPVTHLFENIYKRITRRQINKNMAFVSSIKTYSDAVSNLERVDSDNLSLEELFDCQYVKHQYGRMTYESYTKLANINDKSFFFFPFKSDSEYVTGIYLATRDVFPSVDKSFSLLGFEKMPTPEYIQDIEKAAKPAKVEPVADTTKEKVSIGNLVIESVIDIFETLLTYLTNTMSFMRVGGFVMSHAGLMLVVNILAQKLGGDGGMAWWVTQILGNLFVMGLEGFLVAIQVLRLEFYEMFSRFYEGKGKPFQPIMVDLKIND